MRCLLSFDSDSSRRHQSRSVATALFLFPGRLAMLTGPGADQGPLFPYSGFLVVVSLSSLHAISPRHSLRRSSRKRTVRKFDCSYSVSVFNPSLFMKKLSSITNRSTTARALDIECHCGEKEMNISITLTPRVNIPSRADGNKFGIGEVVDLRCVATPVGSNIAAIGGVGYRIKQGSGKLTEVAVLPGGLPFSRHPAKRRWNWDCRR